MGRRVGPAPPAPATDTGPRGRWFFAFFVVSGFCALLCQVVWLRLALARFGVTAAMVAIVLSVFMAGLALGNTLGGRLVERPGTTTRRVLLLYAGCEVATAASAAIVPATLDAGRSIIAGTAWGSGTYHLASALAVTAALLPFCVAMGATFPLALAAVGSRLPTGRSTIGHLYAANVVGAAVGTLASAFVLIEVLGLRGTLHLGAGLNASLAAASVVLALRAPSTEIASGVSRGADGAGLSALVALFATGFASLAMEVVWVRQFTPLLGNLVYSFALILASYLLATLGGSLLYRARSGDLRASGPTARVWIALALLALLPAVCADPRVRRAARPGRPEAAAGREARVTGADEGEEVAKRPPAAGRGHPWLRRATAVGLVAVAVAPLSALLGFVTPWLVDLWSGGSPRRAGAAWAVNGAGCILGPLAAGFVLLPWLGERGALLALSLLVLGMGVPRTPRASWRAALAAAVAAAGLTVATQDEASRFPDARVRRDATATVIVWGQGMGQRLLVNGVGMTGLSPITKFMSHLPLAFLDRPPRRGLVICFGMGTSFRSMRSWGIETTGVELVPSVPAFFPGFHPDAAELLASPHARVVVDDGRRFLDRTAETYDVVVVDPPPPVEAAGSSLLYSREFYQDVRPRLAEDGIVQAWIPGGEREVVAAFLLALHDVFPYVRAFASFEGWGLHVLASRRPLPDRTAAELAAHMPAAAQADLVAWGPHGTAVEQLEAVRRQERAIEWPDLESRATALTDDRPVNEYFLVRRFLR